MVGLWLRCSKIQGFNYAAQTCANPGLLYRVGVVCCSARFLFFMIMDEGKDSDVIRERRQSIPALLPEGLCYNNLKLVLWLRAVKVTQPQRCDEYNEQ